MAGRHGALLRCVLAVAGSALALRATAVTPAGAIADTRAALATGSVDPFAALVPVVALLAWALVAWLTATVLLTVVAELPGAAGRCAAAAAGRIAPAAVRRAVQLALGLGLAAGVTCAAPASAAPLAEGPGTSAAVAVPSLDWPTAAPAPTATPTSPPPAAAAGPSAAPPAGTVVVAPGDTLWSLAERSLGPGATAPQVAAAWPAWWAANRDVIGPDPHVIHPGDRLTPPPSSS